MDDFGAAIMAAVDVLKIPLTLWGHTFSFWQVFLFVGFVGIVLTAIFSIWGGGR